MMPPNMLLRNPDFVLVLHFNQFSVGMLFLKFDIYRFVFLVEKSSELIRYFMFNALS